MEHLSGSYHPLSFCFIKMLGGKKKSLQWGHELQYNLPWRGRKRVPMSRKVYIKFIYPYIQLIKPDNVFQEFHGVPFTKAWDWRKYRLLSYLILQKIMLDNMSARNRSSKKAHWGSRCGGRVSSRYNFLWGKFLRSCSCKLSEPCYPKNFNLLSPRQKVATHKHLSWWFYGFSNFLVIDQNMFSGVLTLHQFACFRSVTERVQTP